ncbi:MAG: hypothetical protein QN194_15310 [Armatimonadota bacterium]|nr:hypothetical protein [Armatimonadota bacterium]
MSEGDLILALILIISFALLGLATTIGWSRNARETRRIREAVEAWVLQDLARKREQERKAVQPPEDLIAFLSGLLAQAADGAGPLRILEASPIPGEPAFRIETDRGTWILSPALPPGRRGRPVDAIATGDAWVAERLRLARLAAADGVAVPQVERWWLFEERHVAVSEWRASLRRFPLFRR